MIDPVEISRAARLDEVVEAARAIQSCLDGSNKSLGQLAFPDSDEWTAMSHAERELAIRGLLLAGPCWKDP